VDFNPTTDRQGRAALTNAPDDLMKLHAYAAGFLRNETIQIRPDDAEHLITLSQALVVHGTVQDEATGQPIPKFRLAQGWPNWNPVAGTTNAQWSSLGRFWLDFSGGVYSNAFEESVVGGTPNRGYFLKFMADGYQPFVSRLIAADEGNVELNVTLHPARSISVMVYAPNGHPAGAVDVGLVSPGASLKLIPGGFSLANLQTGGTLLRTDKRGAFTLESDPAITRVIVAGADGFAAATPAELAANPGLWLQPWGRLETTCFSGGKPAAGRSYHLRFGGGADETIQFDAVPGQFTTDAQGKLTIEKLPPGQHELMRLIPLKSNNGNHVWQHGDQTTFEIRPGETTTLNLGQSNYTVTARLQWPAGMTRNPAWQIDAGIHTPRPAIPSEIMTNRTAFMELIQSEAYQSALKKGRAYPATVKADDTILVEDVAPGEYELSVGVTAAEKVPATAASPRMAAFRPIAQGGCQVTIPSRLAASIIEAGVIELKPGEANP
jgi:hypothetical protein